MQCSLFQAGGVAGSFASETLVDLADQLVDGFFEEGEADLMTSFAAPLAANSLASVLGLDSHGWEQVWQWCEGLCADIANFANDPELTSIGNQARESLGRAIDQKIDAPLRTATTCQPLLNLLLLKSTVSHWIDPKS
ncbi:MAG: hypothetical protein Ct9H300mP31_05900 [Acidimicrobiaceae bacterium]|nr:MAG: hypothetical protein Ct9H300mP31_05900 [Acidimicrobiaceae bacterium]